MCLSFASLTWAAAPGKGSEHVDIGKIERVGLREVWPHEAHDFTTWLSDNLDALTKTIGLELTSAETEKAVGDFRVDILAEDIGGRLVAIENQLTRSDHDHLGKLITYLAVMEAQVAIWIVADPRAEHVSAVARLNELASVDFYLVKVEAIRIGDSAPAPLLTLIVGPSEASEQAGDTKRDLVERHHLRRQFWTQLLEKARARTALHANISPSTETWVSTSAGVAGLSLTYGITQHAGRIELYIDRGKGTEEETLRIFDQLHAHREDIESKFDGPIEWLRLENVRACGIRSEVTDRGYRDEEHWPEVQDAMIDAMIRFEAALRPHIDALDV